MRRPSRTAIYDPRPVLPPFLSPHVLHFARREAKTSVRAQPEAMRNLRPEPSATTLPWKPVTPCLSSLNVRRPLWATLLSGTWKVWWCETRNDAHARSHTTAHTKLVPLSEHTLASTPSGRGCRNCNKAGQKTQLQRFPPSLSPSLSCCLSPSVRVLSLVPRLFPGGTCARPTPTMYL